MKAAPTGLVMLLNDRSKHVFCPSLQDRTEDLIILIKAVHVPDTKADTTTPNSQLGSKQAPYPETTTGRTNPIGNNSGCQIHTEVPHSSHLVPSTAVL